MEGMTCFCCDPLASSRPSEWLLDLYSKGFWSRVFFCFLEVETQLYLTGKIVQLKSCLQDSILAVLNLNSEELFGDFFGWTSATIKDVTVVRVGM